MSSTPQTYSPPATMNEVEVLEWLSALRPSYPSNIELVPGEPVRIANVDDLNDLIEEYDRTLNAGFE